MRLLKTYRNSSHLFEPWAWVTSPHGPLTYELSPDWSILVLRARDCPVALRVQRASWNLEKHSTSNIGLCITNRNTYPCFAWKRKMDAGKIMTSEWMINFGCQVEQLSQLNAIISNLITTIIIIVIITITIKIIIMVKIPPHPWRLAWENVNIIKIQTRMVIAGEVVTKNSRKTIWDQQSWQWW